MNAIDPELNEQQEAAPSPRRWPRILRRVLVLLLVAVLGVAYLLQDHVRTLRSLRRVPGTNAYVLDYFVDYNIGQIRAGGMDVANVEDGLIDVFFPGFLIPLAERLKGQFIDEEVVVITPGAERCSTIVHRTGDGDVFFGRNFDWKHDASLIVKIHGRDGVSSIAVIDLHYLNLDRDDLEATGLVERIPLLFAPYYLQDGMNQHGVAVADMAVDEVKVPFDARKPNVLHATAMRLILDYARTTDEAIALVEEYNIHFGEVTGHLMIADATGTSAVVEFIDGKTVVTRSDENWQVCTNHRIAGRAEEDNDQQCERYQLASDQLATLGSTVEASDILKIMESVSKPRTMWSSVYNLSTGGLQFAYRRQFSEPYQDRLGLTD